ncbi:hypothetical protein M1N05_01590 [Dehalococcoidales bacterium]|nr:hypothetical protein [Dehalococcoidales bacterium]
MIKLILADALRMKGGETMPSLLDQLWELDKEESYAHLTITPIREGDKRYYQWDEAIQIRPYPNPFGYGGQWGMGAAQSEDEVQRLIKGFRHYLKKWQERGLEKIEVIRKPEMTLPEYKNERRREWLEHHGNDGKRASSQLSLM